MFILSTKKDTRIRKLSVGSIRTPTTVVKNLATGEKRTCGGKELREWLATQALDTMVDFHISFTVVWDRASLHGRGKITHEVHFTRTKRSEVDTDKKHTDDGTHMVEDVPQDF